MNIGLNALHFSPGEMGGVETYLKYLVDYLQKADNKNRYTILCSRDSTYDFHLSNPSFSVEFIDFRRNTTKFFIRGILKNLFFVDILSPKINRLKLDVIHHPFSVIDPINLKFPSVLTFWDMQQEFYPEFFSSFELLMRKAIYRPSAISAKRIIVGSEFTRQCLINRYGIKENNIDVIYFGYSKGYGTIDSKEKLEAVKNKYDLQKPFMYYPAASWPHKNHKALLTAMRILLEKNPFEGDLVLTGIAKASHMSILEEIEKLNLKNNVKVLGYLPAEDLPFLYNMANILVFPSLFEGFGIPLVEAMACGCPVVCSDATTLPEIIGTAGILFDPKSPQDMAEKIWSVWDNQDLRQRMRTAGLARVKEFDWGKTAEKTVAVYRKAAEVDCR
jgi:glycosyltransferase involved in cell wall biosynthesis